MSFLSYLLEYNYSGGNITISFLSKNDIETCSNSSLKNSPYIIKYILSLFNNTILAIAFLLAGTLLTAATTVMAPAYAGGDGNKQKVEDESAGALNDCDAIENVFEDTTFENVNDCIAIAATDESIIRDREPTPPEPEPEPETCEECFERFLGPDEIADLEVELQEANQAESLEDFCENVLEPGYITEGEVRNFLTSAGVDEEIQDDLIECLEAVGIIFEPDM